MGFNIWRSRVCSIALIEACDACVAPASACLPRTWLVLVATPPARAALPAARASARNCLLVFNIFPAGLNLRCPGRAPPCGLHVFAGKQLARTLGRVIGAFVERTGRAVVALRRALRAAGVFSVFDFRGCRIVGTQQWQIGSAARGQAGHRQRRQSCSERKLAYELPPGLIVMRSHG